ncbi:DNA-directed RNA polymerase sigma-70 factor [Adhaeribacter aerolatus]|uniref:DNA-directed RNA polymerase sigma-70 factor n=1 Tax=Adhaeribacter aerolatus TaxID=670289 RepID=A0A512AVI9_9BACT|nr:sigma-70 family RNA polymerase sigma factor [Adhaeribacter aerolatus]GEO03729.1 DNA-directed RNA polymerase sigma-70 factor [Adhaeribacter aerolatus]
MAKLIITISDAEIWAAFREGEEQAYEYIYKKFAPVLLNYGQHLIQDRQLVEDCMHDLFVQLYEHKATLGNTDSIKFYLFRSLRRKIAEAVAHQKKFGKDLDLEQGKGFEVVSSPENQMIDEISVLLRDNTLQDAINQLPKRQREALYLLYFNQLSYKEISAIMTLEVRTVYNQVHNALENLKKHHLLVKPLLSMILAVHCPFLV